MIRASAVYSAVVGLGVDRVGRGLDPERPLREVDLDDGLEPAVGAEPLGLPPHLLHQVGADDAVGEAGEVLDDGRPGQLAARLLALEDDRGQVGPGRVERGRQPRGPRSDDDHGRMGHRLPRRTEQSAAPITGTGAGDHDPAMLAKNRGCVQAVDCWRTRDRVPIRPAGRECSIAVLTDGRRGSVRRAVRRGARKMPRDPAEPPDRPT